MYYLLLIPLVIISIAFSVKSWHDDAQFNVQEIVYGLTFEESEYYQEFWGPLVAMPAEDYAQLSDREKKEALRESLEADYESKRSLIAERYPELTDEQQWLAFITLRVNGSMPIYAQSTPARDLTEVIYKVSGSCNAYALRLSFVLRAFGYDPQIRGFVTPAIQGHVVVTLEDIDGNAVLLDANTNAVIVHADTTEDFFETIADSTAEATAEQVQVYLFPYYERAFLPSSAERLVNVGANQTERNAIYTAAIQNGWLPSLTTHRITLLNSLVSHTDLDLANDRAITNYQGFWNL